MSKFWAHGLPAPTITDSGTKTGDSHLAEHPAENQT